MTVKDEKSTGIRQLAHMVVNILTQCFIVDPVDQYHLTSLLGRVDLSSPPLLDEETLFH
ncbi:hypothetical protein [Methylophaga nitratireducenticrescens]|uniref:Uncharacterized protein n=1 Tax=Methylophaga nitratireducenticrescens TaxID=754476 RepID=I1XK70_METNJ|nr:hypothetical protein [Methylophaga nitratireducenticrescens]